MRKITNRCDVISRTPIYQPSLLTTPAVRGRTFIKVCFFDFFCDKALYSFPISGKQIIMSVSEAEVRNIN